VVLSKGSRSAIPPRPGTSGRLGCFLVGQVSTLFVISVIFLQVSYVRA
jgi:hypothetical protein